MAGVRTISRKFCEMPEAISPFSVEERVIDGNTVWVAIRARGAEWSWLTPQEAAQLGRQWVERYGKSGPVMVAAE
jgi:hypothetical protein